MVNHPVGNRHQGIRPVRGQPAYSCYFCAIFANRSAAMDASAIEQHAGVAARADERQKLERWCRYLSRPANSEKRLALTPKGNVRYELETPYRADKVAKAFEPGHKVLMQSDRLDRHA